MLQRLLRQPIQCMLRRCMHETSTSGESQLRQQLIDAYSGAEEQQKKDDRRDPQRATIILFPGQGTQFVGMAKELQKYPRSRDLFDIASERMKFNLARLCIEGPEEKLNQTEFCQPAVFVTSLAALDALVEQDPYAVKNCVETAGFSVGEYAALVFADVMSYETALDILIERAILMQQCSMEVDSALQTVFVNARSNLKGLISSAKHQASIAHQLDRPILSIAIDLAPQVKVIGGHVQCIEAMLEMAPEYNVKLLKRVNVSGAFHTKLMLPASIALRQHLASKKYNESTLPVRSNYTCHQFPSPSKSTSAFVDCLAQQISHTVKWEQTLHAIYDKKLYTTDDIKPRTYEVGPGDQLCAVLKRFNHRIGDRATAISV